MTTEEQVAAVIEDVMAEAETELGRPLTEDEQAELLGHLLSDSPVGNTNMDRKQRIAYLVANCDCVKGVKPEAIDKLDDAALTSIVGNVETKANRRKTLAAAVTAALTANAGGDAEVTDGVKIADLAEFLGVTTDAASDPAGFIAELQAKIDEISSRLKGAAAPEPTPEPVMTPTGNKKAPPVAAPVTNRLTAEEQEDLAFARAEKNRQKHALVQRLVGNVADDAARQAHARKLLTKPIDELNELVALLPAAAANTQPAAPVFNYIGAAGGPTVNATPNDSANVLPWTNLEWDDLCSPALRKAKA